MNLDVNMIRCFKKVAELEHMSKAADELYISQAHLSRIIIALEKELGVPLFDRKGRNIQLNSCGRLYYDFVLKIFSLLDESVRNVRDEYSRMHANLTVATNCGAYLPDLFHMLIMNNSDLHIKQYSFSRKKLISSLIEGKVDFNIICPPTNNKDFISIPVHKEPAVIIYPENHWLKDYEEISLHELDNESFIGVNLGYGARDSVEIMYNEYDFKPNFVIETADTAMVKQYVLKELGVAVVPVTLLLRDSYFNNRYTKIKEDTYGILALEWKRNRVLNDNDIEFCNTTLKYFFELSKSCGTNTTDQPLLIEDVIESKNS